MKVIKLFISISLILITFNLNADKSHWLKYRLVYYKWQQKMWPELNPKNLIAGQVWMESLWDPRAELKTSREYGFGLGQMTKAWRSSGKVRFNKFKEAKKKYKELRDWEWGNRWDVNKQLIFIFKEDYMLYKKFYNYSDDLITRYSLMLSAYNGGTTLLLREIRYCKQDKACNANLWFCNIATKAARSTKKYKGYGKSFFDINGEYPKYILFKHITKIK